MNNPLRLNLCARFSSLSRIILSELQQRIHLMHTNVLFKFTTYRRYFVPPRPRQHKKLQILQVLNVGYYVPYHFYGGFASLKADSSC